MLQTNKFKCLFVTQVEQVEVVQPTPASDSSPPCADPQLISEEKQETAVAAAPPVNVWEIRKKQIDAKSQKPENEKPAVEASVASPPIVPSMFQVSSLYVVCVLYLWL